jgi:hypothetical protein
MKKEPEVHKLTEEIEPTAKRGEYSNFIKIQHTHLDFRFDFSRIVPEEGKVYVHTRIFMSPQHAKLFSDALRENIERYEQQFGRIQVHLDRITPPSDEVH